MSLEEELAELSQVYHGERERCQALEQLVKDYRDFVNRLDPRFFGATNVSISASLLRRSDKLLAKNGKG